VYLEAYTTRIKDVNIMTILARDHATATVTVQIEFAPLDSSPPTSGGDVQISILDASGAPVAGLSAEEFRLQQNTGHQKFEIQSPKLWWPNGQGAQPLYTAQITLVDDQGQTLDKSTTRFGIKTVEIIQRPLKNEEGKTFMFSINGRDIFAQGVNWIPADVLLPTITRERYFDWMQTIKFGNMNMIRVWGGGIYETEDFFDACDEMGILVWHDYAFACGDYPLHDEFMQSIIKEAEAQTIRIRNRASLALLCGGNEDFLMYDWLK
jgi:beta-mannosidase